MRPDFSRAARAMSSSIAHRSGRRRNGLISVSPFAPDPQFIEACGEDLPFPDEDFDAVLSFWSLNHVEDPERCVAEMMRVLKPGGRARLVLEDTEPGWLDLLIDGFGRSWSRLSGKTIAARVPRPLLAALTMKLKGKWEIEADHCPVAESDLRAWVDGPGEIQRRQCLRGYLTFDLRKHRRANGRP